MVHKMKLTKAEFKGIIKECIKELIKEGAFNKALKESGLGGMALTNQQAPVRKPSVDTARVRSAASRMAGYDEFVGGAEADEIQAQTNDYMNSSPGLKALVENTANMMAKGNKQDAGVYAEIFADTAVNTLPKMMMNDPNRQGYGSLVAAGMQAAQEQVAPEQLEALAGPRKDITHWARLAFGGKPSEE